MSGIAGYAVFDGRPIEAGAVQEMARRMAYRGPDGVGTWTGERAALTHLKLAVTPESVGEVQPYLDPATGRLVVADARLDGRDDLLRELGLAGPIGDAEVVARAYERWGRDAPGHLLGDFAFAIWDPAERSLFAAVDAFGARTFYYHAAPDRLFAFASEPKSLFVLPEVPDALDEVRLGDYLSGLREDPARTIFEAVRALPAAHALFVEPGRLDVWRYYDLAPARGLGRLEGDAGVEAFRAQLEAAIHDRIRTPFPVGSQLSGGLDSSAITALAREHLAEAGRGPLHTFTFTFDATPISDERPFVEAVLGDGRGYVPHFIPADDLSPLGNIEAVYEILEEGLVGGTQHNLWALFLAAKETDIRVMLDGFDGDTVVDHGIGHLGTLAREGKWEAFARTAREVRARYATAEQTQDFEETLSGAGGAFGAFGWPALVREAKVGSRLRFLWSLDGAARHVGAVRRSALEKLWRNLLRPRAANRARREAAARRRPRTVSLIGSAFAARIGHADRVASFDPLRLDHLPLREAQRALLGSANFAMGLTHGSRLSAACGFDLAHPFFDRRLVELCLALPPEQSIHDGWTRYVLRKAVEDVLPSEIAWRAGKADMTPSVERAVELTDAERFREIGQDPGWLEDYIDMDRFRRLSAGPRTDRELARLAQTAMAVIWLRRQWPEGPRRPSTLR